MRIYFAPLEGITGQIYRRVFNEFYGKNLIDKYFSPFIAPGVNQVLSKKEVRDVLPENNEGITLVPQLLGCRAEDILLAIDTIKELGYKEVNINLGCPSGTVVAKKKGAGMLADIQGLDEFLYGIFEKADIRVSVKTRIGKDNPEEFYEILDVYNKYEMEELIIHPRVRADFYKNTPNMEMFEYALENSKNSLCYNGDIISKSGYESFVRKYQNVDKIMIGRGFLRNPNLLGRIKDENVSADRKTLAAFHDRLLEEYSKEMSGERPALFKMKELWSYMGYIFPESEKAIKKIRKSEKLDAYKILANEIIMNAEMTE